MRKKIETGEWEVDEQGRHFRRVGTGCIECPMTISTPYGEFETGFLPTVQKTAEPERPKSIDCPFFNKCSDKCARYGENGCGFVTGDTPIAGKRCPFGDKRTIFICQEGCALWMLCNRKEKIK